MNTKETVVLKTGTKEQINVVFVSNPILLNFREDLKAPLYSMKFALLFAFLLVITFTASSEINISPMAGLNVVAVVLILFLTHTASKVFLSKG
jgi:hypothetical protein